MTLVVLICLTGALLIAVVGIALARGLRRIRRFADEVRWQVTEVRARFQPPGPRRDATNLRRRLQAELRATKDMLESTPDGLIFRADAASVLAELGTAAAAVDRELAAVERFLDNAQQRAALATLRPQAEQLIETTYSARQTILRTAAEDRARRLSALHADVARQAAALDIYRDDHRELHI